MATRGRPKAFESPEVLEKIIQDYLDWCAPHKEEELVEVVTKEGEIKIEERQRLTHQKHITMNNFCVYAGIHKDTLQVYSKKKKFSVPIKMLKQRCEAYAEDLSLSPYNKNATGVIFNLKNNHGWTDKSEVDQNIKGNIKVMVKKNVAPEPTAND